MLITPRWYQQAAINSIYDYFSQKSGNPIVALPTASGKTIVIGGFIYQVMQRWPHQRFMVTTHVKELISQNFNKLQEIWPHAPAGVYSAGLNSRDYMQPIIFGGVQSMYDCTEVFGHRDILFIDEAHLVGPKDGSRYQKLITGLRVRNPNLKVIGLSATIYRQGIGYITSPHEGRIFTDICFDMTTMEGIDRLLLERFLAPVIPKRTSFEIDLSNVGLSTDDFNQKALQAASDKERITHAALTEAIQFGQNRQSWLAFGSGIEHTEHIAAALNAFGVSAGAVHNKTRPDVRDRLIRAHRSGELRCLVGNNIFTTGYDHPPLDFIIDLQATASTSKHVQKYGRGMRVFDGNSTFRPKDNCLILDFGGNTRRLGPINDPVIPKMKGAATGDAPTKICEECGVYNHPTAKFCVGCGAEFEFAVKFTKSAGTEEIIRTSLPIIEQFDVKAVYYFKHISNKTGAANLRVTYECHGELRRFEEFVKIGYEGFAGKQAREWWRARHWVEPPATVDEALQHLSQLKVPNRIHVWINRKYPEITKVEFL